MIRFNATALALMILPLIGTAQSQAEPDGQQTLTPQVLTAPDIAPEEPKIRAKSGNFFPMTPTEDQGLILQDYRTDAGTEAAGELRAYDAFSNSARGNPDCEIISRNVPRATSL